MRYIGGLHITLCPRYVGEAGERAAAQNLFAQASFWNALHILIVSQSSISVELRLLSESADRTIGVYLLLAATSVNGGNGQDVVALALQLMPKEYSAQSLTAEKLNAALNPAPPPGAAWKVARVHRRTQYIDLQSLLPPTENKAGATASAAPGPVQFSLQMDDERGLRHLPEDIRFDYGQMEFKRFCLPLLGDLQEFPSDRRQLFEDLQVCAPAIISIGLHPFPPAEIEEDRQVATRFRDFVNLFGVALANSGFARLQSLQRVFDRYFLTKHHICIATVRVAALNDRHAMAVCHQLCTWLGGMKAFHIIPPSRPIHRLGEVLANPDMEFPGSAQSGDWQDSIDKLLSRLKEERIETPADPRYKRFLIRLPHVYSVEEAAQLVRLPYGQEQGLPGVETRMLPPFFPASQRYDPVEIDGRLRTASPDRIRIGRVNPSSSAPATKGADQGLHWHSIPVRDLCKHALIVGSTGSGKTVTTLFLMRELVRLKIPFLVIEPVKTEYYDSLSGIPGLDEGDWKLRRFCFEGDIAGQPSNDYIAFDPMRLQMGVTVARHVSYLKSCFEAAFPLEAWQALFLENAMLDYYMADTNQGGCGLQLFTRGNHSKLRIATVDGKKLVYPSFETFSRYFLGTFLERELGKPTSNQSADRLEEMRQVFRRRFENLSKGPLGEAFRRADRETSNNPRLYSHFSYLLRRPTIVELDAIPDGEQKSLIMAFLMTFLYERRQIDDLLRRERKDNSPRPDTEHILVIEEAHRLLANPTGGNRGDSVGSDSKTKAVSLFVDMLAEIRAFRQGLVIVEQIPTKLVPAAVKNTNLKIMLRLTSRDDRDYLGEAMSFNESQKQFVNFLRAERGNQVQYVAFDENVDQPILLSLPLRDIGPGPNQWLFDEYFQG